MKYIKTYESFKSSKFDKIDEGILGKLFGKLKNKLSLGFSKQFGTASKVDKLMEEYKAEIMKAEEEKKKVLQGYANYIKSVKDGGEKDEAKEKEIQKNFDKAEANYNKQLEIIKQKFDIRFNEIMEEEENKKIKNYVTLKKLEMQQALLQNELSIVLTDAGLKEEDVQNDPFFQKLSKSIQGKIEGNMKTQKEQTDELSAEGGSDGEEGSSFDLEAAKKSKDYEWKDSPYKDYKFEDNEELKFFSNTDFEKEGEDYKGTTAYVMIKDKQKNDAGEPVKGGEVRITKEKDNEENKGFVISKYKVISTKKKEEEKAKSEEEKGKESKTEETTV